jgi:hypothetical protein
MDNIPYKIELKLSSSGFTGSDVQELLPLSRIDRKTLVGLKWYPCAEGPERFVLIVTIVSAFGVVGKVFLQELSKDLYSWIKTKVQPLLKRKNQPYGFMRLKFNDVDIEFWTDGGDEWLALLESLPTIIASVDLSESNELVIDKEDDEFIVRPYPNK